MKKSRVIQKPNIKSSPPMLRGVAVALAVFAGPLTWHYTSREDKNKFHISLAILIPFFIIVAVSGMLLDYAYENHAILYGILYLAQVMSLVAFISAFAVSYILAMIDVLKRPQSWYKEYYNR